jgi:hypothetical protein
MGWERFIEKFAMAARCSMRSVEVAIKGIPSSEPKRPSLLAMARNAALVTDSALLAAAPSSNQPIAGSVRQKVLCRVAKYYELARCLDNPNGTKGKCSWHER